ncbi:MAG: hypothetical protein RXQ95_03570 [Vulcanisaeta sp.]
MSRVVRLLLGGLFNELTQDTYRRWFVYQMRVSQALLIASLVSFIVGSVVLAFRHVPHHASLHGHLMLGGLVLFYVGIMFSQHPGFTRVMPSPPASLLIGALSLAWFITYVLDLWFSWVVGLIFVIYYIALLIRSGLGRIPLYWPNTFFLSGLVSLAVALYTGGPGIITFPIASIVSLIRRVESRQRPQYVVDLLYAALLPIMTYFMNAPVLMCRQASLCRLMLVFPLIIYLVIALMSLLTFVVIGIPGSFRSWVRTIYSRAYPIGSVLARASLVIAAILALVSATKLLIVPVPEILHLLFIGFVATVMSVLCIPMLNPGILWFSMRFYGISGYEIPALLFISALLRTLYFLVSPLLVMVSLLLVLVVYVEVAVSYLSGERVQVF